MISLNDPSQSIRYWKSQELAGSDDGRVARSHQVYAILLRAWDSAKVEPTLHVVDSAKGPWAASLADGHILLSRQAIDACYQYGEHRGNHLLAFVLAHELAHQRADDLWHQKFFRLAGGQTPEIQSEMIKGITSAKDYWQQLETVEAQADHDAVVMMASVGFDPSRVVMGAGSVSTRLTNPVVPITKVNEGKDFYTLWVEQIWQQTCDETNRGASKKSNVNACESAKKRALRTTAQLDLIVGQTLLYELGVQAFVAQRYELARHYMMAFGRDNPNHTVYSSIAVSYLAEAVALVQRHTAYTDSLLYYPIFLEAKMNEPLPLDIVGKRGNRTAAMDKKVRELTESANEYLLKAQRLRPNHPASYLLMTVSYLVADNIYMARGVLQGQYMHRFGETDDANLMLALVEMKEKNYAQAFQRINVLRQKTQQSLTDQALKDHDGIGALTEKHHLGIPQSLYIYALYTNAANVETLLANTELPAKATVQQKKSIASEKQIWQEYAKLMQKKGDSLLFEFGLQQLLGKPDVIQKVDQQPLIANYRINDRFDVNAVARSKEGVGEINIWLDGEPLSVYRYENGNRIIVDKTQRVLALWQEGQSQSEKVALSEALDVSVGDNFQRLLRTVGAPNRRMDMTAGQYLAYDDLGLGVKIVDNVIAGWFLY